MKPYHFDKLRSVLSVAYATPAGRAGARADGGAERAVLGYASARVRPQDLRAAEAAGQPVPILLGATPPDAGQWALLEAGRGSESRACLRRDELDGFTIRFGGVVAGRPWGLLVTETADRVAEFDLVLARFGQVAGECRAAEARATPPPRRRGLFSGLLGGAAPRRG